MTEAPPRPQVKESALAAICVRGTPITAYPAVRFEQTFRSTANAWLRMQTDCDLAQGPKTACKNERIPRTA